MQGQNVVQIQVKKETINLFSVYNRPANKIEELDRKIEALAYEEGTPFVIMGDFN